MGAGKRYPVVATLRRVTTLLKVTSDCLYWGEESGLTIETQRRLSLTMGCSVIKKGKDVREKILARAKGAPAPDGHSKLYAPSVDQIGMGAMSHDTNIPDITDIAALVDEQRHRLETWPELVAALDGFVAWAASFAPNLRDVPLRHDGVRCLDEARAALARAKSPPAPEDRHQLYPPSVDRRSVEDLHE